MFVIVKFGKNEAKLFNPDCSVDNLLHCIKEECNIDPEDTLDLFCEEMGALDLYTKGSCRALEFLKPRQAYVLIKMKMDKSGCPISYTSLLQESSTTGIELNIPYRPAGTQKRWNEIKNAFTVAEALRPKPLPASTTQAANTGLLTVGSSGIVNRRFSATTRRDKLSKRRNAWCYSGRFPRPSRTSN